MVPDIPEKRPSIRIKLEKAIKVKVRDTDHFVRQILGDISVSGMLLKTSIYIPIGTVLHFEFSMENGLPEISGKGEVVRMSYDGSGIQNGLGIRFIELKDQSRRIIEQIIAARVSAGEGPAIL